MPTNQALVRHPGAGVAYALGAGLALLALFTTSPASAQPAPPAPHENQAFDFMNLLTEHGLHDIHDEAWNAYGQSTLISAWKLPFRAPYTNANGSVNSLAPDAEQSWSWTVTLFLGLHLWRGGEVYVSPEVIAEQTLSCHRPPFQPASAAASRAWPGWRRPSPLQKCPCVHA